MLTTMQWALISVAGLLVVGVGVYLASRNEAGNGDAAGHLEEQMPDGNLSTSGAHRTGARIGDIIANQVASLTVNVLLFVTRLTPGSEKFWKGFIKAGYKGLVKSTGADAVGHLMVGGNLKHYPLEWHHDEKQYKTRNGEDFWNSPDEADNHYRGPGNVSCVWAAASSNELGSHVQAEVAEALDMGQGRDLYRQAHVTEVTLPEDGDQPAAVADGGLNAPQQPSRVVTVNNAQGFEDHLVDLRNDAAARVVSMAKYAQIYPEQTDTDEMKRQEDRGRLAEMDPSARKSFIIKVLLIAAGIIAIVTLGPPLVQAFFGSGGGGGGGGSIIPITLGLM